MINAAERLYGPYRWGRYDLLILPASYPFGGMENPRLTFATPTILAGDRSLVSLVAHELAHSWSGNLVTNATWDDFWLNEGFTTYLERRIMEAVFGRPYSEMLAVLGRQVLDDLVQELGPESPDTHLRLALTGRDPDEGSTEIAYEKGALFLRTIEEAVGRERFDKFLRGYFDSHAFQSMTTDGFLAVLRAQLVPGRELDRRSRSAGERRPHHLGGVRQGGCPDRRLQSTERRDSRGGAHHLRLDHPRVAALPPPPPPAGAARPDDRP
jgi:leukotriene-A4 hydrolase